MSTPLRTGAALDMIHFDGREVARYVVTSEHVMSAKGSREAFGRGKSISMRSVSVHVWVDAPLTARVTLNMMAFDGREVGRSAKSFEVQHVSSTHRLSAKGSRDASLALCVLRARARGVSAVVCVGAPLRARLTHEITHLDGRAVGLYISIC